MAGRKKDATFYPVVYGLEHEEDWTDEANWYKANPSLGHTIQIDRVREAIGMPSKIRRKRTCSSSSGSISGLRPASAGYRNRSTTRGIFPLTGTSCGDGCATAGWTCPVRRISRPWFWLSRHGAMTRNTSCFLSSGCRKTRWNCGAAGTMSYTTLAEAGLHPDDGRERHPLWFHREVHRTFRRNL